MKKLHIALDFDDIIAQTSLLKINWISKNMPNWKKLLAKFKAEDFKVIEKLSPAEAEKKAEKYAGSLSSMPPWLTHRINCSSIIGHENYEKMSYEISGDMTTLVPEIKGVRQGLKEMIKKNHELFIVTYRRKEHLKFVEKWLKEREMEWFKDIHSMREFESKVHFCVQSGMDVIIDDEVRSLRGEAPNLLKILVEVVEGKFDDSITIRLKVGGKPVSLKKVLEAEKIIYVPKFEPNARNLIDKHFRN